MSERNKIKFKLKEVIAREVEARGISLTKLALLTRINKGTLHNWYNGSAPDARTIHHLMSLCNYLRLSLGELLYDFKENVDDFRPVFDTTVLGEDGMYRVSVKKLR